MPHPLTRKERAVKKLLKTKYIRRWGIAFAHVLNRLPPFTFGQRIQMRHIKLATNRGYRICIVADIHGDAKAMDQTKIATLQDLLASQKVDFYVALGDFINDHELAMMPFVAQMFEHLPAPTFAVLGNHDHRADAALVCHELKKAGVTVLNNENVMFKDLPIVGIDSWCMGKDQPAKAMQGVDATKALVLGHEPYLATKHDGFLHLAGHTHHGQIRFPGSRRVFFAPRGSDPYPAGLYRVQDRYIYTTSGIGYSIFPLRVGARPEIVILDF